MSRLLASESIVEAGKRPITRSINDLLVEYEFEQDSLRGVSYILKVLERYQIKLDPRFEDEGSLNDLRTLKARREDESLKREIREIIETGGERYGIEFKASIRINTKKQKFHPGLEIKEYVSTDLETKLAQEICAFLNREGGIILLGIRNDNTLCGCQDDFDSFNSDGSNQDKADLILKQIVEKNFLRPNRVLSNILMDYVELDGHPIVFLRIAKADFLAFLKKDNGSSSQLYIRVGTSAEPILYENIEEHFRVSLK